MKRITIIIVAVIVLIVLWGVSVRNGLATATVDINGKWGEVQTQFERKLKLYENVVATIKGSARNEDTTLLKIVQLRSKIPSINPNDPNSLLQANQGLNQMRGTMLNLNVEAYPILQTSSAFRDFQVQIEGTENRVAIAIRDWNQAITNYNAKIIRFPANIIASLFSYTAKQNFVATNNAENYKVDFN